MKEANIKDAVFTEKPVEEVVTTTEQVTDEFTEVEDTASQELVNEILENQVVNNEEPTEQDPEESNEGENTEDEDPEANTNDIPDPTNFVEGIVIPAKLNVREEPKKDANVIMVLDKNTSVMVDLENSTQEFYRVYTMDFEGYCVKSFIKIN